MTVTVVMVAEKPMLADSIAKLLSDGKATKRKGWNNACSVSEYSGQFMGERAFFKVTSTCGHVMSVDFPQKYNNWEKTDPSELYSAPIHKIEANPKMKMNDYLASEAKGADYLVLWLDCDKEGENICFEVVDAVQPAMRKPANGDFMNAVYRAHFSAITEKDIKAAMRNLGRPNKNEALAVDARQELDLRVGCSFTRFQTKYFQGKYGDLDSSVISFGPCQTPTLAFCVTRHDQIIQFKPEPYWVIQTTFEDAEKTAMRAEWARGRLFDREVASMFLDRIKKAGGATVVDVSTKKSAKERPQALNTVELMRIASASLGLSPATTMHVAESLYTHGYISYPRTETTSYPANFDLRGTLAQQTGDKVWGAIASKVLAEGINKPRGGDDKGDHPPITPMRAGGSVLGGDSARVYEYVVRHFIATLMRNCTYDVTTVKLMCGEEEFSFLGRQLIDPGFTVAFPWAGVDEDERAPNVKKGQKLGLKSAVIDARETSPPGYLTESELITLMEKHGIGTDASIPVHINTICQRNYVTVETGRRLVPTRLGVCLIHGYLAVDRELVLPTMRAELETQLTLIAKGEADYLAVKNHALEQFRRKFVFFVQNVTRVDSLFGVSFTTLTEAGKPFSRCGKCRRFMKLVESRPARLYCSNCHDAYPVPSGRDGSLKTFGDKQCPLDGFDLLYWQGVGGKLARSYAFCPFCAANPPFEGMKNGDGCDHCAHPSCPQSYISSGLCGCTAPACEGVLVLDPQSTGKWRFTCNRCPAVITAFEGAKKMKLKESECEECGAREVTVTLKDESKFVGCLLCAPEAKDQVNLNHAHLTAEQQQRQASGQRGRGRGRGGRGRGG
ncbi:hypothetical protein PENTCL1PPCAC_6000, partial [Pristionchus entomophagus]